MSERKPYEVVVSVSRVSCGGGIPLFGSKILHYNCVEIEIKEAFMSRSLGSDHVHPGKSIAKVALSPTQFADLIINMNTIGTPATLRYVQDVGNVEHPDVSIVDPMGKIAIDINKADDEVKERVSKAVKAMETALESKGSINKTTALNILNELNVSLANYDANKKFYKDQAQKEINEMFVEAKTSFESHVKVRAAQLGIEIKNFFLENKTEETV